MNYIGIDNGVSGGFGFLCDGQVVAACSMPCQKTRKGNEVDVKQVHMHLKVWCNRYGVATFVIEEPGGSKSAKAACSMAGSFHALRSLLEIYTLEAGGKIIRVTPQQWQKPLLRCGTGETKRVALQMAQSLWPQIDLRATPKCRTAHDGIVDALLMAEWARRNNL